MNEGSYSLLKFEGTNKFVGLGDKKGSSFLVVTSDKVARDGKHSKALTNIKLNDAIERLESQSCRLKGLMKKIENKDG